MKPVLQALLLAERIYRDVDSNQFIIAGVFDRVLFTKQRHFDQQPVDDGEGSKRRMAAGHIGCTPSAFVSLTDVKGEVEFTLQWVNLANDRAIFTTEFTIDCDNPLLNVQLKVQMPNLPPIPGTYALELVSRGELIGALRVQMIENEEGPNDND